MSEIIHVLPNALPSPTTPINVRVGTREDMPFMDALQKKHSKALGFFPRAQMEGYVDGRNVLIAEDAATGERFGYVASKDRYLKRDELGAVFQLCVVPGRERGFIGANLLREVFERSSYGCRLYCCWCAQDLPANRFWEAMGFVPIAYRAGSAKKGTAGRPRVHIYWQKRIRAGDMTTPYWFPAKTEGGAIREDRIVLPIPPGMRWTDELPVLSGIEGPVPSGVDVPLLISGPPVHPPRLGPAGPKSLATCSPKHRTIASFGMRRPEPAQAAPAKPSQRREKRKAHPELVAKARELRDKWMEHANQIMPQLASAKYDTIRVDPSVRRLNGARAA